MGVNLKIEQIPSHQVDINFMIEQIPSRQVDIVITFSKVLIFLWKQL